MKICPSVSLIMGEKIPKWEITESKRFLTGTNHINLRSASGPCIINLTTDNGNSVKRSLVIQRFN